MGESEAALRGTSGGAGVRGWGLRHLRVIVYFAIIGMILVSYVLFAFSRGNDVTVKPSAVPQPPLPPNRVELQLEPLAINSVSGEGQVEVVARLVGDLGVPYGNGSQARVPIRLTIDGATPPTEDVSAGEVLAITKPTILLGNSASIDSFPFDSYNAHLFASAERTDGPVPTPVPVVFFPTPEGVSGYDIVFSGVSNSPPSGSGQHAEITMNITRDDDVQAVTILVGIISLGSAGVVLALTTLVVLGRKENRIGGTVVMTAILPFSLILLREVIPEAPPVGVNYDVFVYYPSVIAGFLSFMVCVTMWLTTRGSD